MPRRKFSEISEQLALTASETMPDTPLPEEFRIQPHPLITYEPRVTFQLKPLTANQRTGLRTVLFVIRMLEARVRQAGSIRKASMHLGVSKTFLSQVLRGQKPPGYALAYAVGYVPKTLYLRIPDQDMPAARAGSVLSRRRADENAALRRKRERSQKAKHGSMSKKAEVIAALRGIL